MVHAFLYTALSDHHSCYRATTPHFQALPGSSSPRCHLKANRLGPGLAPPPPPPPLTTPGMPTIFSPLKVKNLLCGQGLDPQGRGDWDKESKHRAAASASRYHSAKKLRGFPGGSVVKNKKNPACQCRFDSWVGKSSWRRKWHPTPVFLPRKFHGQRSLVGYSPRSRKRIKHLLVTKPQQETETVRVKQPKT